MSRWLLAIVLALVGPFLVLVRVSVYAYRGHGLGTWLSLLVAVLATAILVGGTLWWVGRKLKVKSIRRLAFRGALLLVGAYVSYALLYLSTANAKSEGVRAHYASLHPLLRVASTTVILVDRDAVLTDIGRTPEAYALWGLTPNESSLHFEQSDGFVHALDLRTAGRAEWRNRGVELYYWLMGFHSLRHVGTADHLHVSLRPPDAG